MATHDPRWFGNYDRVLLATITGVDASQGTVQIEFVDQFGARDDVPFPIIAMSHDAWMRFVPQVHDVVQVGIRGDEQAVIIGWFPYAYRQRIENFDKNEKAMDGINPEMMQKLEPGEFDLRAKGGGYLRMKNSGDVLLMGSSGNRLSLFGQENYNELVQNSAKITDGFSWIRFGKPYRLFPNSSEREQPTFGDGQPGTSSLIERDTRLVDSNGNVLVRETLGNVIDEKGNLAVSGEIGEISVDVSNSITTTATSVLNGNIPGPISDVSRTLKNMKSMSENATGSIKKAVSPKTSFSDHILDFANQTITQITTGLSGIDLSGLATSLSDITTLGDGLKGIGSVGKKIRYRLTVHKSGKRLYGLDVDEDGGIVQATEDNYNINANNGSLTLYALKTLFLLCAGPIVFLAKSLSLNLSEALDFTTVGKQTYASADSIQHTATTIEDKATISITQNCGNGASTITLTPTGVSVTTTGLATISATGAVNITGSIVNIN